MQTIGRFEVIAPLGQGSQGTVLLARDPDLDRRVAIKLLRTRGRPPQQRTQMLHEARAAGSLRHAGIISVFEAGTHGGDPYLVFEYIAGPTLAQLLREHGALTTERAAAICADVLDALAHAHAAGIVHRDLKPSNILIDEQGHARIMDFGIAARIGEPGDPSAGLIGTPAYMAPASSRSCIVRRTSRW
jgi:eukaryotic-like serine/threonine-protein kinase